MVSSLRLDRRNDLSMTLAIDLGSSFSGCGYRGWVDPDRLGKGVGLWDPSNEAFRVAGPGGLKGPLTLFQHAVGSMMMDILWGEHGDPCVAMLGVVPGEERPAEGDGSGEVVEAPRESGVVLQGLELRLGERIGHLGAAQ